MVLGVTAPELVAPSWLVVLGVAAPELVAQSWLVVLGVAAPELVESSWLVVPSGAQAFGTNGRCFRMSELIAPSLRWWLWAPVLVATSWLVGSACLLLCRQAGWRFLSFPFSFFRFLEYILVFEVLIVR